ncbi:hypothetical protein evm_010097 [Chilo suppressalis]|nr:hypothetical protein evm_010097 [Chilo suppressalis]
MQFHSTKRLTKKNKRHNKIKKRLMEISLKVDHYIYKNKPISAAEASSHYLEVMSFQSLCRHDKRSLQVIEKLSRFMQAIIAEQTSNNVTSNNNSFPEYTNNDEVSSPVYSLTEDDKYELEMMNSTKNTKSNDIDQNNIECEKTIQYEMPPLAEINNFNKNDTCTRMRTEKEDLDEKMAEAIVDLSIDNNESNIKYLGNGNDLCSQSILDVPYLEAINVPNNDNEQCGQDINEIDRAVHDLIKGNEIPITQTNNKKIRTVADRMAKQTKNIQTLKNSNIKRKDKKLTDLNEKNILTELQNINRTKRRKSQTVNHVKRKRRKSQNVQLDDTAKSARNTNTRTPSNTVTSQKTVNKEEFNSNNCYGEDLSWIEKIKFVREINKDECDHSLAHLGESLWENCDLPVSWDDFE